MHSLKILPLSPPPRGPHSGPSASHPPPSFRPALSRPPRSIRTLRCLAAIAAPNRRHRRPRTLRAVIVVLVLWLVRETFSGLLLG